MKTISSFSGSLLCGLAACLGSHAAPVSTVTLEGSVDGPTVRVLVGRTEREKACGIDKQLAGLVLKKGKLVIETHEEGEPIEPGPLSAGAALEITIHWPAPVKDSFEYEAKPPIQRPKVAATDPAGLLPLLHHAIGDSLTKKSIDLIKIAELEKSGGHQVELQFPAPRSGVSKARQFRITRRLAAGLLARMEMIDPLTEAWPPGFPAHPVLCNYDAQGVGYYGSTLLERVVDETTLDFHVVSVCPEDIREGALGKAAGVMFPGGSGKGIATALRPEGVAIVRDFVARGGGYFGVCAGAYFAASGLEEYAGMMPLTHTQPWAKGRGMVKLDLTPEGIALLGSEFNHIDTRYNCGPVFIDLPEPTEENPLTVLARFASPVTDEKGVTHDSMVGTPAILSTTWKKGRVMTISPHPEGHPEFNAMVARSIGWTLGRDSKSIHSR